MPALSRLFGSFRVAAINLMVLVVLCLAIEAAPHPESLYLYGDGIHLSEKGHRRVADALR